MKAYCSHLSTIPLQTKLGCRFQCVYCTYRKIEGADYRLSDPGSVAETALRYAASGFGDIEFVDNVFNAPYDHALAICESLIRAKPRARFQSIELNPVSLDHRLLSTMERAGFVGIGLTVESASDPVLMGLRKGFLARDVHAAAEVVKRSRLPCLWIFLLGGPGETQDTVRETLRFAEKFIRPQDAAFFSIGIRMYPGTELETIARRQGVLSLPSGSMLEPALLRFTRSGSGLDHRTGETIHEQPYELHERGFNVVFLSSADKPSGASAGAQTAALAVHAFYPKGAALGRDAGMRPDVKKKITAKPPRTQRKPLILGFKPGSLWSSFATFAPWRFQGFSSDLSDW